jgi:putative hemolysin
MSLTLLAEILCLAGLFICSAFFSSAETALFSINPVQIHRIRRSHPASADRVETLLLFPHRLLSTLLIGNTLVNVSAAALGFVVAESLIPGRGEVVAIPAMTLLLLLFGEVVPKRAAMMHAERLAVVYSRVLPGLIWVARPLQSILERLSHRSGRELDISERSLTEDEFRTVVEVGEEEGVLDEEERDMVDGIIRLESIRASDVMTPRVDFVGIDLEDPVEEQARIARTAHFRYVPVFRGTPDHAVGFLDVRRFLLDPASALSAAIVSPYFVPETVALDTLLAAFQQEKRRVAFVVDEFGGTAGLITRGDILEEIVADVAHEYEREPFAIQSVGPDLWLVNGNTSLEDVNYELNLDLVAEGADRMAGWVVAQAEHIPRTGEVVEAQGCRVTVQRMRRRRITLVLLEMCCGVPGTGSEVQQP